MSFEDSKNKLLSIGPFGSKEGDGIWDDGVHSTVRQLVIRADDNCICWIQIEYDDNGKSVWSDKHGADYRTHLGARTYKVELDYPDEFLTSVHGYHTRSRWTFMPTIITELNFMSNRRSYGPFGSQGIMTKYFSIEVSSSKIVGFHGRAHNWWFLRALGAYLKPIDHHHHHQKNQEKDVDKTNTLPELPKQGISYIVSGNQVIGNEGDHNGAFVVGSNHKYIVFNVKVT